MTIEPVSRSGKLLQMTGVEVLVAVVIAVALVGVVVPLLPGALLAWSAIVVWGFSVGTATGWAVVGAATATIAAGQIGKYLIPRRGLLAVGVPNRSIVAGALLAIVGFFVIPIVGVVIGFVLGVYASEVQRIGRRMAWPSTKAAVRAVGLSMLLELTSTLLAAVVWIIGVVIT